MKINLHPAIKLILLVVLLSFYILLFGSCGARKVDKKTNKEQTENETKIKNDIVIKKEENVEETKIITIDDKNETETIETIYTPIDVTKPASIITPDGKKIDLNNSSYRTKRTVQKNNVKTDLATNEKKTAKSELQDKTKTDSVVFQKKATKETNIDKKAVDLINWLWLLIPIGIGWLAWKNKAKIAKWCAGIWWV